MVTPAEHRADRLDLIIGKRQDIGQRALSKLLAVPIALSVAGTSGARGGSEQHRCVLLQRAANRAPTEAE